ncbi:M61 family metallopeptidase [Sphingomonas xinjiangensis]|uniref:Putative metalloprotease with PDZ domain n=1 Tax=Sphingomonas xinjiangensis TaxID=643568 RepID=A0A840YDL8_9SPHN|nr:M61 family metallopeptidase [Sphingomonas xinjiangensis]MBB5708888.1 putative metalloprotease with PDZ domain [Sphingomonas xinjiangensis]
MPASQPAEPPVPEDRAFPGTIRLHVDARDVLRRIFKVREIIPIEQPGQLVLLFPEWLPGYHAPQAPIELFAGLKIQGAGRDLAWKRHPTQVHAFYVDVPEGVREIEAEFQFLSPTDPAQGRVVVGPTLLSLQWNAVLLYPAGYFARQIAVEATLTLPDEWQAACALKEAAREAATITFETVPLDVLVDSPVFAGRYFQRLALDERAEVHLNIVADSPELLAVTPDKIAPHRALIAQTDALFGTRHFDRYEVLLALSEEIGSIGVEHHRSCEAVTVKNYFSDWDATFSRRDTVPHEFVHSWNGKYRRGADSWTPSFDQPIRNSLMWVYEGQTQYWDRVLCARSGLWTAEQAMQAIALTAATQEVRAGSRWRPMSDTTRDPIIAARAALPWASWQRSEDYYAEGSLVWLDVDTRIRELSGEARSLDDFAQRFFGTGEAGDWTTNTYDFEEVITCLNDLAPFDWRAFFLDKIEGKHEGAPLAGIERGGFRLTYRSAPSAYWANTEKVAENVNLMFSLGLIASETGNVQEVLWEGPAFDAGLTTGTTLLAVNGDAYSAEALKRAVAAAASGEGLSLRVRAGKQEREADIRYTGGHRYPHLEPVEGARPRLLEILAPRS